MRARARRAAPLSAHDIPPSLKKLTIASRSGDELAFSGELFPAYPSDAAAFADFGLLRAPSIMAHCVHLQVLAAKAIGTRPRHEDPTALC